MHTIVTLLFLVVVCVTTPTMSQHSQTADRGKGAAVFEVDLWPEEGRPRLVAGTTTLIPYTEPRTDAPTGAVIHIEKGQLVEFREALYRTVVPGRLKVTKDSQVKGRRLGSILRLSREDYYSDRYSQASLPVRAGETIEYLQYRAEGSCFVRIRGEVIDADPCPDALIDPAHQFAVLETEPKTEWWIRVVLKGRPEGWLLVDGKNVREEADAGHCRSGRSLSNHVPLRISKTLNPPSEMEVPVRTWVAQFRRKRSSPRCERTVSSAATGVDRTIGIALALPSACLPQAAQSDAISRSCFRL